MTPEACYNSIGADYKGVLARMGGSEQMLRKFALKFLNDKTAETLFEAFANGNQEEAFRMAHTLKGVCLNLGFTKLRESSSALTEALRNEMTPDAPELFERVKADYEETVGALRQIDA